MAAAQAKILSTWAKQVIDVASRRMVPNSGLCCTLCHQELCDIEGCLIGDGPVRVQFMACRCPSCARPISYRLVEMPNGSPR